MIVPVNGGWQFGTATPENPNFVWDNRLFDHPEQAALIARMQVALPDD